jgi:hypothetical protein
MAFHLETDLGDLPAVARGVDIIGELRSGIAALWP